MTPGQASALPPPALAVHRRWCRPRRRAVRVAAPRHGPGQARRADRARLGRGLGRGAGEGRLQAVHRADRHRRPPRPDRGQRDPAQDLGRGRPGPGPADPRQLGHLDQRHQVGAARRDRGPGRPRQPQGHAAGRPPRRLPRRAADQHVLLRLRHGLPRRGVPGRQARQLGCPARPQVQGPHRALRRRHRLPSGGRHHGRRDHGRHPGQHAAGLGFPRQAQAAGAAAGRGPRLHHLVPERRDRRRLHHPEQRPRRQAERHRRLLDGAQGGGQGRHRRHVDPQGPAGERAALGEGVRQLRHEPGSAAGLDRRPGPARACARA